MFAYESLITEIPETPLYVDVAYAAQRTGLPPGIIEIMTQVQEPAGIHADGPLEPVIGSRRGPRGLLVNLADAVDNAIGIKCIHDLP